jgi:pimeloyl-ACP methyl ester carboxylesterase
MTKHLRRALATVSASLLTLLVPAATAHADEPIGTAFGKPCAAVYIIVVPGSYETEDLGSMSTAVKSVFDEAEITEENTDGSVDVHYIDYPARIVDALAAVAAAVTKSPIELGRAYKESKDDGYDATWSTMNHYGQQCVDSKFVLLGYSQGAHIAGDIAATIANEGTPVSADRVRGVHLLADPARDGGYEPLVGDASGSNGLAVLAKLNGRNFGSLSDRTIQYCMRDDAVCDASLAGLASLAASVVDGKVGGNHLTYDSALVPGTDQTYLQRLHEDVVQELANLNGATF